LGLYQLQFLEENIRKREYNYKRIEQVAGNNPELICPEYPHISRLSNFVMPMLCRTSELRGRYLNQFSGAGVEIRPMIAGNIQKQPFYRKYVSAKYDLPGADFIHDCGFYCGNYPELTEADLETLSSCLRVY
jgi:CDP-6-deoxy-D-xylo-4-hexulose-3-dehydrase